MVGLDWLVFWLVDRERAVAFVRDKRQEVSILRDSEERRDGREEREKREEEERDKREKKVWTSVELMRRVLYPW
jgi:hypothetical protein